MKRYTAAQARARLSHILDTAEAGDAVVIERRGMRFTLQADRVRRRTVRRASIIQFADPAVTEGRWTWTWGPKGLRFARRSKVR